MREKNYCCYRNKTRCCKNCPQEIEYKTAEEAGEFIGTKIAWKMSNMNSRNIEEIIILLEKRQELLNYLMQIL